MRISSFDLREMNKNTLLSLAHDTLKSCPLLTEIYDKEFLENLASRPHCGNHLLWLLASKDMYTLLTWKDVCKYLNLLRDCGGITKFRDKLRSETKIPFENYLTELEFAGHYKELGYDVELEPAEGIDFKVEGKDFSVLFQVMHVYLDEVIKIDSIVIRMHERLEKIEEPFAFNIYYSSEIKDSDLKPLERFIKGKLKELKQRGLPLPVTLLYPNEKAPLAEIHVITDTRDIGYGFLGGYGPREVYSAPTSEHSKNIRRKMSKKISKLPKGEANVIVIKTEGFLLTKSDVENALFGDPIILINKKDHSIRTARERNGLFNPNRNTRLSAVVCYEKTFRESAFVYEKTVYHNPFTEIPLAKQFFAEPGVTQLVPVTKEDGIYMESTQD